jgi:hypothetical protein
VATVFTILFYLAAAGAIASFVAGALVSARAGASLPAIVAWPFATSRLKGTDAAAALNKALVALIACLLIAFAAFSASTNLHRFAK